MWNKIKEWLKSLWKKFLAWLKGLMKKLLIWLKELLKKPFFQKIKAWFIKNWFMIVNYLVIFIAYNIVYGHEEVLFAEVLLGLWLFFSVAFTIYKWFMRKK